MSVRKVDRSRVDCHMSMESVSTILIGRLQIYHFSQLCMHGCRGWSRTHRILEQLQAAPSVLEVVISRKPDKVYDASA